MSMSKGARRKREILDVGLSVWRETPDRVNASHIASLIGITHGTIIYHYQTAEALRAAIATHAVEQQDEIVVPMLIAANHPAIAALSDAERAGYLSKL